MFGWVGMNRKGVRLWCNDGVEEIRGEEMKRLEFYIRYRFY